MSHSYELAMQMLTDAGNTVKAMDCRYWECNSVPQNFFCKNAKLNALIRLAFRLSPINFRKNPENGAFPIMPQQTVALLQAFTRMGDLETVIKLTDRVLTLRSPQAKNFALAQGSRICISLYDDSADTPTPLCTAWFADSLLLPQFPWQEGKKKEYLLSIAEYFLHDLGFQSFGNEGIYFFYGHALHTPVIINASTKISALLMQIGSRYGVPEYIEKGKLGIRFAVGRQNPDGSWDHIAGQKHPFTDSFHQVYILKALSDAKVFLPDDEALSQAIAKGSAYYRKVFWCKGENGRLFPRRYDPKHLPHNSWIFQQLDGRDIAEAIIWFGCYQQEDELTDKLISYLYHHFYNAEKKYFYPEKMLWGRTAIPYMEFEGWYLSALAAFVQKKKES